MRQASVLVLAGVVTFAGCAGPNLNPSPRPVLQLVDCSDGGDGPGGAALGPPEVAQGLANSGLTAFCGQLEMAGPTGTYAVQVGVLADRSADPLQGRRLLVYHPGGPGISTVRSLFGDPPDVDYGTAAVLAWDGATASTTTGSCGPLSSAYGMERDPRDPTGATAVGDECGSGVGADSVPGAATAAQELEVIRQALAVDQIDVLAFSYGTAIAQVYLRSHGERVGRVVLDGPLGVDVQFAARRAAMTFPLEHDLNALMARCAQVCDDELASAVASGGYSAVRAVVLDVAPRVGSGSTSFEGVVMDQATLLAIRDPASWDALLETVNAAAGGDASRLWTVGRAYVFGLDRSVYYASLCSDIDHPLDEVAYRSAEAPPIAAFLTDLAPCAALPQRTLPSDSGAARGGDVLVVASDFDSVTPVALVAASEQLQRYRLCRTQVVGHTSARDPVVAQAERDFLATGDVEALHDACLTP